MKVNKVFTAAALLIALFAFSKSSYSQDNTGAVETGVSQTSAYDASGYDANGFDKEGYDKKGLNKSGHIRTAISKDTGFNQASDPQSESAMKQRENGRKYKEVPEKKKRNK